MSTDHRPGSYRTFNDWISMLHWDVRFCRRTNATGAECQAPLGHATLGETPYLRLHVAYEHDPVTRRAARTAFTDAQVASLPVSAAEVRRLQDEHPASGPTEDEG